MKPHFIGRRQNSREQGFSLAELAAAIGIAGFCLISILGLLPIGLQSSKNSSEQTAVAGVATLVAADLRNAASVSGTSVVFQFNLSNLNTTPTLQAKFVTEGGNPTDNLSKAHYRANVWLSSSPTGGAVIARILTTWPTNADPSLASPPSHYSGSMETVITLNCK